MIAGSAVLATGTQLLSSYTPTPKSAEELKLKNNIHHSVCRWCFDSIPLESFCQSVKEIGIPAIDLVAPKDWPMLQKYGLYSSMCYVAGNVSLTDGFAETSFHAKLIPQYLEVIPLMKEAGYTDVICFSGSRRGMDNDNRKACIGKGTKKPQKGRYWEENQKLK